LVFTVPLTVSKPLKLAKLLGARQRRVDGPCVVARAGDSGVELQGVAADAESRLLEIHLAHAGQQIVAAGLVGRATANVIVSPLAGRPVVQFPAAFHRFAGCAVPCVAHDRMFDASYSAAVEMGQRH